MNLNKEILRLSVPAIVSNITVPLLGLSDTIITGHLGDESYIGAIAVGSMMINTTFWLFGFLRMGTTGLTAQAYGAGDHQSSLLTLGQSVIVALLAGLAFILLQSPLSAFLCKVMGASQGVETLASEYFRICIWAAPAQLCVMCVLGWFLGMQDTVRPMIISISLNVLNIALSLCFVLLCGMGFRGVAFGTLIANWCALVLAIVLLFGFGVRKMRRPPIRGLLDFSHLRRFFTVNANIFFRSACIMGVTMSVTAIGARIGDLALAANAVLMQFFMLFSYFMDGLAFTGEALSGRYAGEGNAAMLRKSTDRLLLWSAVLAFAFLAVYAMAHKQIIGLITDVPEVVAYAQSMAVWIMLMPPLTVGAFIFDGFYIGLTATGRMLRATMAATAVFFAIALLNPSSSGLIAVPTNNRLWAAFIAYLFCRGLFLALGWKSTQKRAIRAV
ncbi:MAG: MATE family efflux transporter [Clostridium sp.]|nr:MATE family efflux transporter [Clostridium sp.]